MTDKWASDLLRALESYQQRMPENLSSIKTNTLATCIENLKNACIDVRVLPVTEEEEEAEYIAPKTKLWVVRTIFDDQIYQCCFDDIIASRVYCEIIFPFISSLLKNIIRGSNFTDFTSRDFLKIMHSKQSVIRLGTVESALLPPGFTRCVFCGCGCVSSQRGWEVKRLADTTVIEWRFDKKCEDKIIKVVNIYNLMRCFSLDAAPFSVCKEYTVSFSRLNTNRAYVELMILIADVEKEMQN